MIRRLSRKAEAHLCAQAMVTSEPWVTLGRTQEEAMASLWQSSLEAHLALEEGRITGFVLLDMHGPLSGYVKTLCTFPGHRGRGVGSRLLAFAEKRVFSERANVFMCVSSFNKAALRLYLRLGYEQVGQLENLIVRGHSELLLRKTRGPIGSCPLPALVERLSVGDATAVLDWGGAFAGYILSASGSSASLVDLLDQLEARAFTRSPNLYLDLDQSDPRAHWEERGFRLAARLSNYLTAGDDRLLLRKSIGPTGEFTAPRSVLERCKRQ